MVPEGSEGLRRACTCRTKCGASRQNTGLIIAETCEGMEVIETAVLFDERLWRQDAVAHVQLRFFVPTKKMASAACKKARDRELGNSVKPLQKVGPTADLCSI